MAAGSDEWRPYLLVIVKGGFIGWRVMMAV